MTDEIRNKRALLRYTVQDPRISGINDAAQSLDSFF